MSDVPVPKVPLYFTFGNHMHWVDMQWLWGYDVLPGSIDDMIRLCDAAEVKGNINFDGVGYEKMAAECPEALAHLRNAVERGAIEPVGCTYGQPYALFNGPESSIRQLVTGVRTVRRLLGVFPRTFWEEEFCFHPQLPQMIAQCGFTGACLFFQWTWHTPQVPVETVPLIQWEGIDGTRVPTLPRHEFNIHQWPEEFDGLLESIAEDGGPATVVQWLELMPSRDWMCRTDLILPRLRAMRSDPRFEVRPRTAGDLITELSKAQPAPVRQYRLDDMWHGMSLGKNGDRHPRESLRLEQLLLTTEALASLAGLFGRPYPHWDVYPTWELEEAWRKLMVAQHHDNHECEGLCGAIGQVDFKAGGALAEQVVTRVVAHIAGRIDTPEGSLVAFNPCGIVRDLKLQIDGDSQPIVVEDVPPFGFKTVLRAQAKSSHQRYTTVNDRHSVTVSRDHLGIRIDKRSGYITQLYSRNFPDGMLRPDSPLGQLSMITEDGPEEFARASVEVANSDDSLEVKVRRHSRLGATIDLTARIASMVDAFELTVTSEDLPVSQSRMLSGLRMWFRPSFEIRTLRTTAPYSAEETAANGTFRRKYPTGDWMTSPQVYEEVARPFTSLQWLDMLAPGGEGLMVMHDGSQQWFRDDSGVCNLLSMHDAWDEDYFNPELGCRYLLLPHQPMTDSERAATAMRVSSVWSVLSTRGADGTLPRSFGLLEVTGAPNVLAQCVFRDSMKSGECLPRWAGHRMRLESNGACTHPFVIRLVEWDGSPASVTLKLPGPIALAAKTNLLGEVIEQPVSDLGWLVPSAAAPPPWCNDTRINGKAVQWNALHFSMRGHEIATIMVDLEMGRKIWRDLDSNRDVWAKAHRV